MMKMIYIGFLIFVFCSFSRAQICDMTTNIVVQAQPLWQVGHKISRLYNIRVCTEASTDGPLLTFDLQSATLERVLHEITLSYTNYVWEYDNVTESLDIYPADASRTSWVLESLDLVNVALADLLKSDSTLGLNEHGINFDPGRGNLEWLETHVTVQGKRLTARQVLNVLCAQLPFRAHWEIRKTKPGARGKLMLTFRGF